MSKIFKNGVGVEAAPFPLKEVAPGAQRDIRAFSFRRVDLPTGIGTSRTRPGGADQGPSEHVPAVEIEEMKKAAYQQGYSAGERDGAERITAQFHSVMQSFRKTTEELAGCKSALRAEAKEELVRLALAIARRVIHREVQVDPEAVLGIVGACIDRIDAADIHRLRVNPADAQVVTEFFRQSGGSEIEIVPDQSVRPGGAILHTTQGQLDARLESQLWEIEYGLTDH